VKIEFAVVLARS